MENTDKILTIICEKIEAINQRLETLESIDYLDFISNNVDADIKEVIITNDIKDKYKNRLDLIKRLLKIPSC